MIIEHLKFIFEQFDHIEVFKEYTELASGHINDTYLITSQNDQHFVLQRINSGVFKDVPGLIANIRRRIKAPCFNLY